MILNENEMVICDNKEELLNLALILEENGYHMINEQYDPISRCNHKPHCVGVRWLPSHTYPYCIAHTSEEQLDKYNTTGKIEDGGSYYNPICITYKDFYQRIYGKDVEIMGMV